MILAKEERMEEGQGTNRYLSAVASQNESGSVVMALRWSERVFRPTALFHVCGSSVSLLPERSLLLFVAHTHKMSSEQESGRESRERDSQVRKLGELQNRDRELSKGVRCQAAVFGAHEKK